MNTDTDRITPSRGKVSQRWKIGTFDIETIPNVEGESALIGKYAMGATCLDHDGKTVRFFPNMLNMMRYMLSFRDNIRWFAHNGANFDFKYFIVEPDCIEWLIANGYSIEVIGGSIPKALAFKKGKKTILFCDSVKLMNNSLADLCQSLHVETSKGHINFDVENFDSKNRLHLEYLKKDVISLWQVVDIYRNTMINSYGVDIKCTASSTSFNAFRRTLQGDIYRHSKDVNMFCRQAYFGARTECFFQGEKDILNVYDVNSLYAHIMFECGGVHRPFYTDKFEEGLPGFYRVEAKVPEHFKFGPLPVRFQGTIFPVGNFATYASNVEIELALEMGAEIRVLDGYAFEEHDKNIFKPYIQKCMDLRMLDYKGAMGTVAKYNQNNLYGFFGMNPDRESIIFSKENPGDNYCPVIDQNTGEDLENLWSGTISTECSNVIPAYAAWITANARVLLLRAMLKEENIGNVVYYCDTDSMFLDDDSRPACDVGLKYGQWKHENNASDYKGISAKSYMYTNSEGKDVMKAKGISNRLIDRDMYFDALQNEEIVVNYTQLNSLKAVMSGKGLGRQAHRTFARRSSMGSRVGTDSGFTLPLRLDM